MSKIGMVISMLKKVIILLFCFTLVVGCGKKEKELDLNRVSTYLQELTNNELDYNLFDTLLEDINDYNIYTADQIFEKIGLEKNMYQSIFFCEAKHGVESILVIKPIGDVEDIIKDYWKKKEIEATKESDKKLIEERIEQVYKDHLIYIIGKNANEQLKEIKESKQSIFSNMIPMRKDDLKEVVGIDVEKIEGYTFFCSDKLDQVSQYLIVKVDSDSETTMKQTIHNYFERLEEEWVEKDTTQYQLIKNRMEKTLDSYLIYLVSTDNEAAFQVIKKYYK